MRTIEIPGPIGRRPRRIRAARVRQIATAWFLLEEMLRRLLDLVLALILLVALSPLLLLRALYAKLKTGRVFDTVPALGIFRVPFEQRFFAGTAPGRSLFALVNVLKGEMSFIGPRVLTPDEAVTVPLDGLERFWIRPGIVSAYWLRKGIGVAYETENQLDREFYYGETLRGDLGLMARALLGAMLGKGEIGDAAPTLRFFGIDIANVRMSAGLDWIAERSAMNTQSQVCFVNPDCLNIAYVNSEYRRVLTECELVLPDGIGIHLAGRIQGMPMLENLNGTDLFPRLCERATADGIALYLMGARPGIAAAVADAMLARYPRLRIAGTHHGFFDAQETGVILREINSSGADVLLLAMGAPRQDLWLATYRAQLKVPMLIGVGGLFDFYSGNIRRAPVWMREIGLEWVWRLMQEPRRMWHRYLVGNPLFLYRVWKEVRNSN